jgi:CBS domain-containing protein
MRAPFTAIAFVLELTHDVNVVPALLVACVAADLVTVLLMKRSILTEKVARRGHHVMREYGVSPMHQLRVADVMEENVPTVPATLALRGLFARLVNEDAVLARRQAWLLVDDAGQLAGLITRTDLLRALEQDDFEEGTVLDAGTRSVIVTHPDELLEEAAARMLEHDIGRLAVVDRDNPRRLVGYLGRTGMLSAWLRTAREERQRDPGWLSGPWSTLQQTLKRVLVSDR